LNLRDEMQESEFIHLNYFKWNLQNGSEIIAGIMHILITVLAEPADKNFAVGHV